MELVLERFVAAFSELYKDKEYKFKEEIGRIYFTLFLKPSSTEQVTAMSNHEQDIWK